MKLQISNFDSLDACAKCKVSPKLLAKNMLFSVVGEICKKCTKSFMLVNYQSMANPSLTKKAMVDFFSDIRYVICSCFDNDSVVVKYQSLTHGKCKSRFTFAFYL